MNYENTLILYTPSEADEILNKEKQEAKNFQSLLEKMAHLREFDADGFDEMVDALRCLRDNDLSKIIFSYNLIMEFGLQNNAMVNKLLQRQDRILAIVRSNKNVATLLEAADQLNIV